ncbi:MAG: glycosyltransferase family 4 protein [Pseudomonadota bacterium]
MTGVLLAVPGRLDLPTGGYEYARRVLTVLAPGQARLPLSYWPLPDLGLAPEGAALDETARRLAAGPTGWPVLIDGLAFGVLPPAVLDAAQGPVAALVHHPLALEHGLGHDDAARLRESERLALGKAEIVITTSTHTAATLTADYGVPSDRIAVARPGIPRPAPFEAPVTRLPDGGGAALLSIGTLIPRKGHDVLIGALAELRSLPWHLTLIGDPTRDPAHADRLRMLAVQLGLEERVSFAGVTDRAGIAAAYAGADLFVLASRYEGYGMAYAEAMIAGLPVVGSDAGAVAEATGGGACLVPPGHVAELADVLRPLLESAEARAALADRGRVAARALNDWDATAAILAEALLPFAAGAAKPAEASAGHRPSSKGAARL